MPTKPQVNEGWGALRAFARGVPVGGELLDEGFAAADATFGGDRNKSWGQRWSDAVDEQRAYDAAYDAQHPWLSAALQTAGNFAVPGGAVVGAVPKMAKALDIVGRRVAAPLAKSALARKIATGAAEGIALGAGDGFLAGEGGLGERAGHALHEAGLGALWGAAKPVLSSEAGRKYARDGLRQGVRQRQRLEGILGRFEPDTPLLGLIPLPHGG